jgi:hypothetical protein
MQPAIAPLVTATSVMLAAYGFFYNALKGRIEDGFNQGDLSGDPVIRGQQRQAVESARNVALLLGIVPLVIWLVFLKETWHEIKAAIDVCFAISHYSTLDVVFVLLASSWLLIAILLLLQALSLHGKIGDYADPAAG